MRDARHTVWVYTRNEIAHATTFHRTGQPAELPLGKVAARD